MPYAQKLYLNLSAYSVRAGLNIHGLHTAHAGSLQCTSTYYGTFSNVPLGALRHTAYDRNH